MPVTTETLIHQCCLAEKSDAPLHRAEFEAVWEAFCAYVEYNALAGKSVKIPNFGIFSVDEHGTARFAPAMQLGQSAKPGEGFLAGTTFRRVEPVRHGEVAASAGVGRETARSALRSLFAGIAHCVKSGQGVLIPIASLGTLACPPGVGGSVVLETGQSPRAVSRAWHRRTLSRRRAESRRSQRRLPRPLTRATAASGGSRPGRAEAAALRGTAGPEADEAGVSAKGAGASADDALRPTTRRVPETRGRGGMARDGGERGRMHPPGSWTASQPNPGPASEPTPSAAHVPARALDDSPRGALPQLPHAPEDAAPSPLARAGTRRGASRWGSGRTDPGRAASAASTSAAAAALPYPTESSHPEASRADHAAALLKQAAEARARREREEADERARDAEREAYRRAADAEAERTDRERREMRAAAALSLREQAEAARARARAERAERCGAAATAATGARAGPAADDVWPFSRDEDEEARQDALNSTFRASLDAQTRARALKSRPVTGRSGEVHRRDPRFRDSAAGPAQSRAAAAAAVASRHGRRPRSRSARSLLPAVGPAPGLSVSASIGSLARRSAERVTPMGATAHSHALKGAYERYQASLREEAAAVARAEEVAAARRRAADEAEQAARRQRRLERADTIGYIVRQAREKRQRDEAARAEARATPLFHEDASRLPFPVERGVDRGRERRAQERMRRDLDLQVQARSRAALEDRLAGMAEQNQYIDAVQQQMAEDRAAEEAAKAAAAEQLREEWGRQAMLRTIVRDLETKG